MEKANNQLTPEESLRIISETIVKTRENFREDSFYYLLWGWTISITAIGNYFLIRFMVSQELFNNITLYSFILWGISIIIGSILQSVHNCRVIKDQKVKTQLDKYIHRMWQASGALFILLAIISMGNMSYPAPYILAAAALPTFVSGIMLKFTPLITGALFLAGFSLGSIWIHPNEQLLVYAAGIICGFIIPGYILRASKDKHHV